MIRQFYVVFEIQIFKRVMLAVHLKNAYYNKNRYIYMSCDLYHSLKTQTIQEDGFSIISKKTQRSATV